MCARSLARCRHASTGSSCHQVGSRVGVCPSEKNKTVSSSYYPSSYFLCFDAALHSGQATG